MLTERVRASPRPLGRMNCLSKNTVRSRISGSRCELTQRNYLERPRAHSMGKLFFTFRKMERWIVRDGEFRDKLRNKLNSFATSVRVIPDAGPDSAISTQLERLSTLGLLLSDTLRFIPVPLGVAFLTFVALELYKRPEIRFGSFRRRLIRARTRFDRSRGKAAFVIPRFSGGG